MSLLDAVSWVVGYKNEGGFMQASRNLAFSVVIALACSCAAPRDDQPSQEQPPEAANVPAPTPKPDPTPAAIGIWLTSWSTAQAASIRATCEQESGCDPSRYMPDARPETTFGWDGPQRVERIADWARGPRYRVRANRRNILIYLESGNVVSVDLVTSDGGSRNLCRDQAC